MAKPLEQVIEEALHKIGQERKYENYSLDIQPVSSGGANFSSCLFKGTISEDDKVHIKWFAKIAIIGEQIRAATPGLIYEIEQYAYTHILRVFKELQNKFFPKEFRLAIPEIYGCWNTPPQEVIVLQDLSAEGFVAHDRQKPFSWQYASTAVQQLAIFHALTLALEHTRPKEYEETVNLLKNGLSSSLDVLLGSMFTCAKNSVQLIKEENRGRVENYVGDIKTLMKKFYSPCRRPVIVHGDYRMSNIVHKLSKNGDMQLYILDYQTLHVGSVVNDLYYLLATGSDGRFRRAHQRRLLDFYYDQICRALTYLGLSPFKVYSRDDYEYELKENLSNLLLFAFATLPLVTMDESHAPELNQDLELDSLINQTAPNQLCVDRLNEVVDDFIAWGVL